MKIETKAEGSQDYNNSDYIDIIGIIRAIWRGKVYIFLSVLALTAISIAYIYILATPQYRASAVVVLESHETEVSGIEVS